MWWLGLRRGPVEIVVGLSNWTTRGPKAEGKQDKLSYIALFTAVHSLSAARVLEENVDLNLALC
jgi:hypothetical protein